MLRRLVAHALAPAALCRHLIVSADIREGLTKPLSSLKEECKGQNLDLADMAEAMKGATYKLQEVIKKSAVDDKQFKGKAATLSASLKAYNTRLANLQNETRSIQAEIDAIMKLLWGTERPEGANFATPPAENAPNPTADFEVEPPPIARALGEATLSAPSSTAPPKLNVERVEGERVETAARMGTSSSAGASKEEEIEVETIEVDVEPPAEEDPVETMKVTDITKELYERGVNFSDCMDARTLRQRYRDVLSGKIPTAANQSSSSASHGFTEPLTMNTNQPRMPQSGPPQQSPYPYQQQGQSSTNNAGSGITNDPYPNAHRKMVDPMKFVYQIKQELALEKGIDAGAVDLWSGKIKLDDNKRLYDYPSIQSYPIEVRQKGDIPA
ncbi:protein of unknown function - conserved [Leishmania donovani]|uniref:Uncharacterized protein n=3 Tax=Leishmania donovani species complex TaxID=38574 RepID=A4I2I5_LEIIN|nr:conserved hypothetical protein [Leishmania infantum JPCM5]XP_003861851.1 hypothetical protein, conserved [Leishmania donovani]CAC9497955.1 hypothetical_protein_-_conserved [Leishmania infantum]AYU79870.1 hypothetical protein LdCL_260032600 [Leishmania donovani]TPP41290.1 hypothetical protein CGC21_32605 [Leishmania donovani]TPP52136.1 hypothetical protein CGC20_5765 [Leishmania donovani]CAJ1989857.1 protein of unknown function - conserved [Leishmania donovani]|eukprot:XP_001470596.1 conserved hypothetical protein [Leishmania infantum JPCM5]